MGSSTWPTAQTPWHHFWLQVPNPMKFPDSPSDGLDRSDRVLIRRTGPAVHDVLPLRRVRDVLAQVALLLGAHRRAGVRLVALLRPFAVTGLRPVLDNDVYLRPMVRACFILIGLISRLSVPRASCDQRWTVATWRGPALPEVRKMGRGTSVIGPQGPITSVAGPDRGTSTWRQTAHREACGSPCRCSPVPTEAWSICRFLGCVDSSHSCRYLR